MATKNDKVVKLGVRFVKPSFELVTDRYWEDWEHQGLKLIEECGRVSHKSENRITETSAVPFIKKIALEYGHESILEHCHVTGCFLGSRTMSHQLVRHRIAAITQESQRYCDYAKPKVEVVDPVIEVIKDRETPGPSEVRLLNVICPPSIYADLPADLVVVAAKSEDPRGYKAYYEYSDPTSEQLVCTDFRLDSRFNDVLEDYAVHCLESYLTYSRLRAKGVPSEDARFSLPNASKTEVYITMNLRTWRHFFLMRASSHAQWEIRQLALQALAKFKACMPAVFTDVELDDKMVRLSKNDRVLLTGMLEDTLNKALRDNDDQLRTLMKKLKD